MSTSQALKDAFTKLMTCSEAVYGEAVFKLVDRLEKESKSRELSAKENLVIKLNEQYPRDVGVLAAFFLNLVMEVKQLIPAEFFPHLEQTELRGISFQSQAKINYLRSKSFVR